MLKMKRYLFVGLLILALVAVPLCATACEEEEEPPPAQQEEEEEEEEEVVVPQYGGTITTSLESFTQFDPYRFDFTGALSMSHVYDYLFQENWYIDRSIFDFPHIMGDLSWEAAAGGLIKEWEIVDENTMIFHVRDGVYFQDKEPVNGRQLTADDIIWNTERLQESPFWVSDWIKKIESMTAIDDTTIEVKLSCTTTNYNLGNIFTYGVYQIVAPESVNPETNEIDSWEDVAGTGPFILDDYVADSYLSFVRNPDYWEYDAEYPENQLPYVDSAQVLIISEYSTWMAAMRTGKIDYKYDISYLDAQDLLSTNPDLQYKERLKNVGIIIIPDLTQAPFNDIKVRQAMQMALNLPEIAESYYHGVCLPYINPVRPDPTGYFYTAYEELPDEPLFGNEYSIKELLTFNKEEALTLLDEAGYGDGLAVTLTAANIASREPGLMEVFQAYMADVNITVNLDMYDWSSYLPILVGHTWTGLIQMTQSVTINPFDAMKSFRGGERMNQSGSNDPVYNEWWEQANAETDVAARKALIKQMNDYILENVWYINFPDPMGYFMWQPWLQGYNGEALRPGSLAKRLWIDQALQ
jgi:peptide/nickel transport system substrate-binding protein